MSKEQINQIKIRYNPYRKSIQYWWRSNRKDWEPLGEQSKLTQQKKFQMGTLQHRVDEILEIIAKEYCQQGADVELVFEGTESDWTDIRHHTNLHGLRLCEHLECTLMPAPSAMERIEAIFDKLAKSFASHENSQVKEYVDNYQQTVRPEIPICVMGTYSAGKSTFINALIGEEILPSAKNPTTAKVFKIVPLPSGSYLKTRILFQYGTVDTEISFNRKGYYFPRLNELPNTELKKYLEDALSGAEMSPAYIYQAIEALNQFRPENGPEVSQWIELQTPFHHSNLPLDQFHFVIYDTPGSNSTSHKDHTDILKEALKEQTDGLPIILTAPTTMDADDAQKLLELIQELGDALDRSNILAVIGQADTLAHSDISDLKNSPSAITSNASERIFFLSPILGLGAKKEDMTKCVYDNDSKVFRREKEDYITGESKLYEHDVLSAERFSVICAEGSKANAAADERVKLLHNSGLWAVENEITLFAEKYALYNKCAQAQEHLKQAIELANQEVQRKQKAQEAKQEMLTGELSEKKQGLIKTLKETQKNQLDPAYEGYHRQNEELLKCYILEESTLRAEADRKWISIKHLPKDDSAKQIEEWARRKVDKTLKECLQDLEEQTNDFWEERIKRYKDACIQVVSESDALTDQEKAFMEEFIPSYLEPKLPTVHLDVQGLVTKWQILFWKWAHFDSKTCAKKMKEELNNIIRQVTQSYGSSVQTEIKRWSTYFRSRLTEKLAEFNPNLRQMSAELYTCSEQLRQWEEDQRLLQESADEINSLLQFGDEQ